MKKSVAGEDARGVPFQKKESLFQKKDAYPPSDPGRMGLRLILKTGVWPGPTRVKWVFVEPKVEGVRKESRRELEIATLPTLPLAS